MEIISGLTFMFEGTLILRSIFLLFSRNYFWLMLAAVRALVEQQPVEEDYSKFR